MATVKEKRGVTAQTQSYAFTLDLAGISELTPEIENALYESGCGDALFGTQRGTVFLDFEREAPSLIEAVVTAIKDVERTGIEGLKVIKVRPPDLTKIEMINSFLSLRTESTRSQASFDDEFWQLLLKMRPSG